MNPDEPMVIVDETPGAVCAESVVVQAAWINLPALPLLVLEPEGSITDRGVVCLADTCRSVGRR